MSPFSKQSLQQGKQEGEAAVLIRLLSRRFGTIEQTIRSLSIPQLEELTDAQFDFTTSEIKLLGWIVNREYLPFSRVRYERTLLIALV